MLDASRVFYPGHDLPFRIEGENIITLGGPSQVEFSTSNEGGDAPTLSFRVHAHREPNIDTVQKRE